MKAKVKPNALAPMGYAKLPEKKRRLTFSVSRWTGITNSFFFYLTFGSVFVELVA